MSIDALAGKQQIISAIRNASQKVGVDFDYMVKKAGVESSFRPDLKAKTSSATGLYQFLDQTWLGMIKQHGEKYGMGNYAESITQGKNGRLTVNDQDLKIEILALREDPETAALMAAEFAKGNQNYLQQGGIETIGETELYLAHFLGAGGSRKFLQAMHEDGNQTAAKIFPSAAHANKNVFYHQDGQAKSLKDVYAFFTGRMDAQEKWVVADTGGFEKAQHLTGSVFEKQQDPFLYEYHSAPNLRSPSLNSVSTGVGSLLDPEMLLFMLQLNVPGEDSFLS